jgi:hypothetical protein
MRPELGWFYTIAQNAAFETLAVKCFYVQGGSNMTGTNCDMFTHIVLVIFEPPCITDTIAFQPRWFLHVRLNSAF